MKLPPDLRLPRLKVAYASQCQPDQRIDPADRNACLLPVRADSVFDLLCDSTYAFPADDPVAGRGYGRLLFGQM